jgi:molecular chaperone Hsp33
MNKALTAMDTSGSFRVHLAITTDMVEEARRIHQTSPLATAALGRVLTGAGLMGVMMKNPKDKLTVQFKGDGPAKEILATAKGSGAVKGYISVPSVDLPLKEDGRLDVGGAIGIGTLTVIKDQGMKEPYLGRIDLASGEIAEDFTAYFFLSEQQSTSVVLGVRQTEDGAVAAAGGMIIQMMPEGEPGAVEALEERLATLPSFSQLVWEAVEEAGSEGPEAACDALLHKVFDPLPEAYQVRALAYGDIGWDCDCSVERLEQVLLSIGETDLRHLVEEDGKADLTCQFCTKKYHFDREHMEMLLRVAVKSKEIIAKRKVSKKDKEEPS